MAHAAGIPVATAIVNGTCLIYAWDSVRSQRGPRRSGEAEQRSRTEDETEGQRGYERGLVSRQREASRLAVC